jgi:hypothetical protein
MEDVPDYDAEDIEYQYGTHFAERGVPPAEPQHPGRGEQEEKGDEYVSDHFVSVLSLKVTSRC